MMDSQIAEKILDRIAELSRGNEERTMEYLTGKGGYERQKRVRDKKIAQGLIRMEVWADPESTEALRQRFPGPKQGVSWPAVIEAALAIPNTPEFGEISADPNMLALMQELRGDLHELDVAYCALLRENAELKGDLEQARQEAERLRHDLEYERNERGRKPARK